MQYKFIDIYLWVNQLPSQIPSLVQRFSSWSPSHRTFIIFCSMHAFWQTSLFKPHSDEIWWNINLGIVTPLPEQCFQWSACVFCWHDWQFANTIHSPYRWHSWSLHGLLTITKRTCNYEVMSHSMISKSVFTLQVRDLSFPVKWHLRASKYSIPNSFRIAVVSCPTPSLSNSNITSPVMHSFSHLNTFPPVACSVTCSFSS